MVAIKVGLLRAAAVLRFWEEGERETERERERKKERDEPGSRGSRERRQFYGSRSPGEGGRIISINKRPASNFVVLTALLAERSRSASAVPCFVE